MWATARVFAFVGPVLAEPPLGQEDMFLLQTRVATDDPFAKEENFGPGWHCLSVELDQWCGCNDYKIAEPLRRICPDLCPPPKKGGCGFDTSQCNAAGCKKGTACCLKKGTTEIKWTAKSKDVTRENRQKCFDNKKQNNDWCSAVGNQKYCGKNGFDSPDDSKCKCNIGTCSETTPKQAKEIIGKQVQEETADQGDIAIDGGKGNEKKEAKRKKWVEANKESINKKWHEKREKKNPADRFKASAITTTPNIPPSAVPPSPPSPPPPPSKAELCRDAKCKKGRSCCVRGKKMLWDVGGKDITVKNRQKCLDVTPLNIWCTQNNFEQSASQFNR